MEIGSKGIALIKTFEGCKLEAYQDSVGVWTVGYGHIHSVVKDTVVTQEEADTLLSFDLKIFSIGVTKLLKKPVQQHQFDALVSFAFNLGVGNLRKSTLLKLVNTNPNDHAIRAEFLKWNKAGGKVLTGLTRRRTDEATLYFLT